MYANVVTGDCAWELPPNTQFKPADSNQWWELHDANTQRAYFYNVTQNLTTWQRPEPPADIIPLAKLQEMQEELARAENEINSSVGSPQSSAPSSPVRSAKTTVITSSSPNAGHAQAQAPAAGSAASLDMGGGHAAEAAAPYSPSASSSDAGAEAAAGPALSSGASSAPPAPAVPATIPSSYKKKTSSSSVNGGDDLSGYSENLSVHKKGIFRKRVSLATMLSWTKDPISKPMLTTHNKKNKKEAVHMFLAVQMYMNDRNSKGRDPSKIALDIIVKCWSTPPLRDEIFIQLCKQTTSNRSTTSCERGWELLCICLNFFPPSNKFFNYLAGYISKHTDGVQQGDVIAYAEHALKKLDRVKQTGAKRGKQEPTLDEVEHARHAIFHPSVFGSTLEEIMDSQKETHPDLEIPWCVKMLIDALLANDGPVTEGIFRVPGDIDAVNLLKVAIDREEFDPSTPADPHVLASTLKLFFRELHEPVIPPALYHDCVAAADDPEKSVAILDRLPRHNHVLLKVILRMLQRFVQTQSATKMSASNLAMIYAPSVLSDRTETDVTKIFEMSKHEMSFVLQLLLYTDTTEVSHLV